MSYRISQQALDDIEEIWVYTFKNWSIEQADRYVNLLFDEIEYLVENPESGKDYNDVRAGYRCSKVKSHLIFYRIQDEQQEIEVIRVLHQQMDIKNRLA